MVGQFKKMAGGDSRQTASSLYGALNNAHEQYECGPLQIRLLAKNLVPRNVDFFNSICR